MVRISFDDILMAMAKQFNPSGGNNIDSNIL
jgi:hypothetical protein